MFVKDPSCLNLLLVHLESLLRSHVDQLGFGRLTNFSRFPHRSTWLPASQLQLIEFLDHSLREVATSGLVFTEEMIIKLKRSWSSITCDDGPWTSESCLRFRIYESITPRTKDMSTRSPRVILSVVVTIVAQPDRQDLLSFRPHKRACRILRLVSLLSRLTNCLQSGDFGSVVK